MLLSAVLVPAILFGQAKSPGSPNPPLKAVPARPPLPSVLNLVTAASLKGNLSFLSSDALAGRYTPSPGLDVAAEFIASQFRAAGLEPGGDQDYFQIAKMVDRQMPGARREMTLSEGSRIFVVPSGSLTIFSTSRALDLERSAVLAFDRKDPDALRGHDLSGKVVIAPELSLGSVPEDARRELSINSRAFDQAVASAGAAAEILVGRLHREPRPKLIAAEDVANQGTPVILADSDELRKWLERPNSSAGDRTVSFEIPAPIDHPVSLKNVIGVLRGSDPKLKNTCVLLTAHYDHIGTVETGRFLTESKLGNTNDRIFNGANDDGSGTVSVIEIAKALAKLHVRPKRSVVFVAFFGEERGDIGSGYYGKHPAFPIADTVADVNLEQVGRIDSTTGKQLNSASLTGFDYSDVTGFLQEAGRRVGIRIYLDKEASDAYFVRSDNAALAEQGVPAHTLCVAFDYPDYHGLADEWQKIDYENMAKIDRAVALGVLAIANSLRPPQWNASNPNTAPFREAQARVHH